MEAWAAKADSPNGYTGRERRFKKRGQRRLTPVANVRYRTFPGNIGSTLALADGIGRQMMVHRMSTTEDRGRAFEAFPFVRPGEETSPALGPTAQRHIASSLRTMYSNLVQEPLPEQFLDLIARLDQSHQEME